MSPAASLDLPHFSTLTHKQRDLHPKKGYEQNVCFDFHYNFCLKHFSSRIQRDFIIPSTHYSYQILIKLELSRQIFQKSSNILFHENPSSRCRVVPRIRTDGLTGRQHEANSRISQFIERTLKHYLPPGWCYY
jgi:hypothetical protein